MIDETKLDRVQNGWRQGTFEIRTSKGLMDVPSLEHELAPGVAVTMHAFGLFDVTHKASGMKMAGAYERASTAALVMAQFATVIDCTVDRQALARELTERADEPVPLEGHTVTELEGGKDRPQTVREWFEVVRFDGMLPDFPWESPEDDPWAKAQELLASRPEEN